MEDIVEEVEEGVKVTKEEVEEEQRREGHDPAVLGEQGAGGEGLGVGRRGVEGPGGGLGPRGVAVGVGGRRVAGGGWRVAGCGWWIVWCVMLNLNCRVYPITGLDTLDPPVSCTR